VRQVDAAKADDVCAQAGPRRILQDSRGHGAPAGVQTLPPASRIKGVPQETQPQGPDFVREIDDDEGRRLVRIVRRGSGSVVTWRRAQMVLLSAQGTDAAAIAKVTFTSEDRVRDVIRNFNADGFGSLYPKYKGGYPPKFTLPQRREIKKIAKAKPAEYDLPFAWSLAKLLAGSSGDGRRRLAMEELRLTSEGRTHLRPPGKMPVAVKLAQRRTGAVVARPVH
jgi:hypothetical protein